MSKSQSDRDREKAWRAANQDKVRASRARWLARNPEYRRAARRRWMRGKRLRGAGLDLLYDMLLRYDPCAYCGGRPTVTDHIVPQTRGGADAWENYTAACQPCNDQKGDRGLLLWLALR